MKRIAILLALAFSSVPLLGQVPNASEACPKEVREAPDSTSRVYKFRVDNLDEEPQFQGGGVPDFAKWVVPRLENVDPETCIIGRIYLQFVVKADGSVADIKVVRSSSHPLFDEEAIRVVSGSPKWKPGKHRGEAVDVLIVLPIVFSLQ